MCIEVRADDGTRILLDMGMPLAQPDGSDWPWGTPHRPTRELVAENVLRQIPGLYADDEPGVAAIILTHAHLDHYGLVHHAHPSIPVYGSRGTVALMGVAPIFLPEAGTIADLRELPADGPLRVGPFSITAIPVDHSAPDSRALLVEADGQRLFYSGDLRAHGRTGYHFDALLRDTRLRDLDAMLLEGTTIGQPAGTHGFPCETDVEEGLVALATERPDSLLAVAASGQNLDRLVSCYRAAVRTGREMVIDPYQAYVLRELAMLSDNIPQFTWEHVRVKFVRSHVTQLIANGRWELAREMAREAKVSTAQLAAEPARFLAVVRSNAPTLRVLDALPDPSNSAVVWSMWGGYWDKDIHLRPWCEKRSVEPLSIHSGGHAHPRDLQRLITALNPRELKWVHTEANGTEAAH